MTNTQRLDNVENELETVKQLLVSTARYGESANSKLDRLVERQDLTQSIQIIPVAIDTEAGVVELAIAIFNNLRYNFKQHLKNNQIAT